MMPIEDIAKIMNEMKDSAEDSFMKGNLTPRQKDMHDKTLDVLKERLKKEDVEDVFGDDEDGE